MTWRAVSGRPYAEGLDGQLAAAAEAFCAGEVRVVGPPGDRRVALSKIVGSWYAGDFGVDTEVGWCSFIVSKPALKAPMVSALETIIS